MTSDLITERDVTWAESDPAPGTRCDKIKQPTKILVLQHGRNYKVPCLIGITPEELYATTAVFDTGAGPNLIRSSTLPKNWRIEGMTQSCLRTRIVDAHGNAILPLSRTELVCQVGIPLTKVEFIVVDTLAVDCIRGCDFIDRHVRSTRPAAGLIELNNSGEVRLIAQGTSHPIRLAKAIRLPL
jgi:hypothetical protein